MRVRFKWPIALAAVAGLAATCLPAAAQYWGDRYPGNYQQGPFPFFGNPAPPPVVDSTKAPVLRKLTVPPTSTVVVIGDSMADWLGYGLDETYSDQPAIGVDRLIRANSGLVHYDPRSDTLEWSQAVKDALANEKPSAIVVMLGLNDRVPLRIAPPKPEKSDKPDTDKSADKAAAKPADKTTDKPADKPADQAAKPADTASAPADTEAPPQDNAL